MRRRLWRGRERERESSVLSLQSLSLPRPYNRPREEEAKVDFAPGNGIGGGLQFRWRCTADAILETQHRHPTCLWRPEGEEGTCAGVDAPLSVPDTTATLIQSKRSTVTMLCLAVQNQCPGEADPPKPEPHIILDSKVLFRSVGCKSISM